MFAEILLAAMLGCGLGVVTGLIPGLHVNTIAVVLVGLAGGVTPLFLGVIVVGMALSHTLWDFVPSLLLGAPDEGTALSILPGHRLLLEGRGHEALFLTVVGGVGGVILTTLAILPLLTIIPLLYQHLQERVPLILGGIALFMIVLEPGRKKLFAAVIFFLSGMLGLLTLDGGILPVRQALLPLLSGLFGMSTLLVSLSVRTTIPPQKPFLGNLSWRLVVMGIGKGIASGALLGTLPGVGAGQATVLAQEMTRRRHIREFLISVGAINTIVALFSLISLYTILKPRSGAAVAVQMLLPDFALAELTTLFGVALFATGMSATLLLFVIPWLIRMVGAIPYTTLTMGIIFFLLFLTLHFSGFLGLVVLGTATAIGVLAPLFGVKRTSAMGVLMVPIMVGGVV